MRQADLVGRWGGEEFIILLPNTELVGAMAVGDKIRRAVADYDFPIVGSKTLSLGASQSVKGESFSILVERADKALYRAKQEGRNRVCADGAFDSETPDCALS